MDSIEKQFLDIVNENPDVILSAFTESEIMNAIILNDWISRKYTQQQIAIKRKVTFRKVRVVVEKYKKSLVT